MDNQPVIVPLGWPLSRTPTPAEMTAIQLVFHELSLHEPALGIERCTYLASYVIARLIRDQTWAPK